jgi:hypothetical protein
MKNLLTKAQAFIRDEEGASAVECGLLVAISQWPSWRHLPSVPT